MGRKKANRTVKNIDLKNGDISAILCALPLINYLESDTPDQDALLCNIAAEKLLGMLSGGSASFSFAENAVIADAIHAALEVVSGRWPEVALELDADWRRELTGHLFALNRLYPHYVDLLKAFQAEM